MSLPHWDRDTLFLIFEEDWRLYETEMNGDPKEHQKSQADDRELRAQRREDTGMDADVSQKNSQCGGTFGIKLTRIIIRSPLLLLQVRSDSRTQRWQTLSAYATRHTESDEETSFGCAGNHMGQDNMNR